MVSESSLRAYPIKRGHFEGEAIQLWISGSATSETMSSANGWIAAELTLLAMTAKTTDTLIDMLTS